MHTLKVRNGLGRRPIGHQKHTQVVIGVAIRRVKAQNSPEFFFREVKFLLVGVNIPKIIVSLCGVRSKLQGFLECLEGIRVILLVAFDNSQQVVTVNAGRIPLEFLQHCGLGLIKMALLHHLFHLRESGGRL